MFLYVLAVLWNFCTLLIANKLSQILLVSFVTFISFSDHFHCAAKSQALFHNPFTIMLRLTLNKT